MTDKNLNPHPALTFGVGIPAPEPGYYPNVPADVYHAWDAASNSRLQLMKNRSPAHLYSHMQEGSAETDALRFGSAAHMAILEPELFSVRYRAKERCMRMTGAGTQCQNLGKYALRFGEVVCGTHFDRDTDEVDQTVTLMSPDDFEACAAMRRVAGSKMRASGLISGDGEFELSLVWHEQVEVLIGGELVTVTVPMKARIDRYSPLGGGTIVDLKTTDDASRERFERSVWRYGYHMQGALYKRGAKAVKLPARHFAFMAAEKSPPYEMSVYRLDSGALDAGEEMALTLLKLYARCKHTGEWPGYPDKIQDIALPTYAWRATDDDINELEEAWRL